MVFLNVISKPQRRRGLEPVGLSSHEKEKVLLTSDRVEGDSVARGPNLLSIKIMLLR